MREAQLAQYNYILVVGEEEAKNEQVSYFFCCKFLAPFFSYLKDGQISWPPSELINVTKMSINFVQILSRLNNVSFFVTFYSPGKITTWKYKK